MWRVQFMLCLLLCAVCAYAQPEFTIGSEPLGPMGTGSKFFRCGLSHSSGVVFLGTYGPEPAIIWKYDPKSGELKKIAEPGEYQLDSMVEAPNGIVYIGTAYSGLVYKLDPKTEQVTSLGSPPIESTSWIFTMIRTSKGEIYGAKGVGLFKLDWRNDTFETIGVVPGDHTTLGPNASSPITRMLVEDRDGMIWGDTNRWLFRFDPTAKKIEPVADMALVDPSCYALFLPAGPLPTKDLYFCLYSRFSGQDVKKVLYAYRKDTSSVEPVEVPGLEGVAAGTPTWWNSEDGIRLLIPERGQDKSGLLIVDPLAKKIEGRFADPDETEAGCGNIMGPGMYFFGFSGLKQAQVAEKRIKLVAPNPVPVDCRCLAASAQRVLGTDTYDCGHAFTLDVATGKHTDHGKVWSDDHRCNYGPAAFAGAEGRYFLANHSQAMQSLWVTDTQNNRHWKIGDSASQLHQFSDGIVWGVVGPNPNTLTFDDQSWRPGFQAIKGTAFRYEPGSEKVQILQALEEVSVLTEAPGEGARGLAVKEMDLCVYDPQKGRLLQHIPLPAGAVAAASDKSRNVAYILCEGGVLLACRPDGTGALTLSQLASSFGQSPRGFFVLAGSGRVVGLAEDGTASVFDPRTNSVARATGPVPLPAGPAVDPKEDGWYFAGDQVVRYTLVTSTK